MVTDPEGNEVKPTVQFALVCIPLVSSNFTSDVVERGEAKHLNYHITEVVKAMINDMAQKVLATANAMCRISGVEYMDMPQEEVMKMLKQALDDQDFTLNSGVSFTEDEDGTTKSWRPDNSEGVGTSEPDSRTDLGSARFR